MMKCFLETDVDNNLHCFRHLRGVDEVESMMRLNSTKLDYEGEEKGQVKE